MTTNKSLHDVFKNFVEATITNKINTILPAKIIKYDSRKRTITAKPIIMYLNKENVPYSLPNVFNVPLMTINGNTSGLRLPETDLVGQDCILLFAQCDIDEYKYDGISKPANTSRKYDYNDCIAIYGLNPFNKIDVGGENLELYYKQSKITIKPDGDIDITSSKNVEVKATNVNVNCTEMNVESGTVNITDELNVGLVGLDALVKKVALGLIEGHIHAVVPPIPPILIPTTTAPATTLVGLSSTPTNYTQLTKSV